MSEKFNISKIGYQKNQFEQTVDTQFTQFVSTPTASVPTLNVTEFFQVYNDIFFEIPKFGETNSHQLLINQSSNYTGETAVNEVIQALTEEVNTLRQENLELQEEIISLQISGSI